MIQTFRRNNQISILIVLIYTIGLGTLAFFNHQGTLSADKIFQSPYLSQYFKEDISFDGIRFWLIFSWVITTLIIGFSIVQLTISHQITTTRTQLPAILYAAASGILLNFSLFSTALIAALVMLIIIRKMFNSTNDRKISYSYFDISILLSLTALLYFNIIFIYPFLFISQIVLKNFRWREQLFILLGFMLVILYFISFSYLFDSDLQAHWTRINKWVRMDVSFHFNWILIASLSFLAFMVLIASGFAIKQYAMTKIQIRRFYQIFFYLFVTLLASYFIVPSMGGELIALLGIALSMLFSVYFTGCKIKFFNRLLFYIILAVPILLLIK